MIEQGNARFVSGETIEQPWPSGICSAASVLINVRH